MIDILEMIKNANETFENHKSANENYIDLNHFEDESKHFFDQMVDYVKTNKLVDNG